MDDQTDEDFFDKLVEDDDGLDFKPSDSVSNSFGADGSDSDEAKAFANLSLGDENVSDLIKVEEFLDKKSDSSSDSVIEHGGVEREGNLASVFGNISDSPGGGVKEVQWAAFGADTGEDGNGYSDLFNELDHGVIEPPLKTNFTENDFNSAQYQGNVNAEVAAVEQSVDGQAQNNVEYWENQYPGWKFDANTGQWYQIDSQISYLQQSPQSVFGVMENSATSESVSHLSHSLRDSVTNESVLNWTEVSQESGVSENISNYDHFSNGNNNGYPQNMIFDPQYPGWYYHTISLEWRPFESYTSSVQSSTAQIQEKTQENIFHENVQSNFGNYSHGENYNPEAANIQNHENVLHENVRTNFGNYSQVENYKPEAANIQNHENVFHENVQTNFSNYSQVENYKPQGTNIQNQDFNNVGSLNNYNQQSYNMWHPDKVAQSGASWDSIGNQQFSNYCTNVSVTNNINQNKYFDAHETVPFHQNITQGQNDFRTNGFVPTMNFNQPINQPYIPQNQQINTSNDLYGNQNSLNSPSPQFQSSPKFSQASNTGRSSAGRPPHALFTFGFGGKLIVMKNHSSFSASSYGTQGSLGGTISVFNLMEVVMEKSEFPSMGAGGSGYFNSLCKRSFSGPLVGGNFGTKELNKWIDEKISSFDTPRANYRTDEVLKLLFLLLKISCQYYGKLRSPFGTEATLRENDAPESAVAQLFASVKENSGEFNNYNALAHCLQSLPSEEQMRANAAEVQRLLVSGKKKEALEFATNGQLWGPALVLAAQLGDQYYCETVKQMALRQLVAGSPLRTLCLLIAGQPADVFSSDSSASSVPGSVNMFQQSTQLQHGVNSMLGHWEENVAMITANRTKDDEFVLVHLGDSLWKNRSDIIAAHLCYLVADANFELYSDTARLCLIGADHLKLPRTYASPDAIQRTEIYEYSKVLGNSQFILPSFQPYKFIYALMLAEVGKISESLKYCQAVLKSIKTGRTPDVDTLRQLVSSFEERLKTLQQGGFSSNLAPAKIVGKLLNLFDSTAHRVAGGLSPPIPSPSRTNNNNNQVNNNNEQYYQNIVPRVSSSQSTMAMLSLIPSASADPVSEGNRMSFHNRSVSEPDIGATPRQGDSSKEISSTAQGKASAASRFGRFGFGSQLLQKTVGLVLKPRQGKQAKLGDTNKFYYDKKLKRWVEEGAEPPAEEAAPPPPPTTAAFQNGIPDYNMKNASKSEGNLSNLSPEYRSPTSSEPSSGIPPIPTSSNQFSARGRMGVRSRYVDTFNKGGNSANLFQSPAVPSPKPVTGVNPKFFVPSPVSPAENSHEASKNIAQEPTSFSEMSSLSPINSEMTTIPPGNSSFSSPPPSVTMHRFPSMDNITRREKTVNGSGLISSNSRRTASWSGSLNDASNPPNRTGVKPLGEVLGMPPSLFMSNNPSVAPLMRNNGSFGEELHEVEL